MAAMSGLKRSGKLLLLFEGAAAEKRRA